MILCYHDIDQSWQSPLVMPPDRFDEHCQWLADSGRVSPLEMVLNDLDSSYLPRDGQVALTFDDGLVGMYEHGLSSLSRHGLPFTVYIVAATLTPAGQDVDWIIGMEGAGLQTMSSSQIEEVLSQGGALGSHSWKHADLTTLDEADCVEDLRKSREFLEDRFGVPVETLAYPRGRNDAKVRRSAEAAGYSAALALPEAPEPYGRYCIPRVGVYAQNGTWALRLKASRRFWAARMSPAYPAMRSVVRAGYRAVKR